ncbi:MAG TPA: AraC family transcriptional regulator ligand-binding domain-containing protein [Steroidobacteraceae bacterium]|nr:AraC family transcriptional regulator ligand-binding domain-containing protein [Steroidobacteraceae bacterium]
MTSRANPADTAPTLWARMLRETLAAAARCGLDADALRGTLGLAEAELEDADARLPLDCMYRLFELCIEHTRGEAAPLRVMSHVNLDAFDALGVLATTSATVEEAMDAMWRYARVFIEGERYTVERTPAGATYGYLPWGPSRPAHAAMAELFARDLAVNIPQLAGVAVHDVQVRLRHEPTHPQVHAALLGGQVQFGAGLDEVTYTAQFLAQPLPRANPMFQAFALRYLDARLAALPPESPLARAHQLVVRDLARGELSLEAVARELAVSPRTLQRALGEQGTSFSALVDDVRRARALALLRAGAAVVEVAWLVGYSEPSPFVRAVKRWTGVSPVVVRGGSAG